MKYFLTLLVLFSAGTSVAQVTDDFSDGNFTNNPAWSGNDADFNAAGFDLHLAAAAAGESYLSTAQSELGETTWEFLADLDFNITVSNHAFFFLVSDQSDLSGSLNGYYVSIGSTNDDISLYKQTGTTKSKILDGTNDVLAGDPIQVRIRVTRDAAANWSVYYDTSGGTSYTLEGSVQDNTYSSTSFVGVRCVYSSTRKDKIGFDDISVSTVAAGFGISSLAKEGNNSIRITFNQNVDQATAEAASNYTLNYGFGNPASAIQDMTNPDEVLLTFASDFVNNDYTLNIDQVQNQAMDETITNVDRAFNVEQQTPFRNIVINEIMADPSPQVGLPNAEFLELHNPTNQAINIGDFMIDARNVPDFVMEAGSYVTLTTSANAGSFTGHVVGLSGLSLGNNGEALQLTDNLGNLVDSVSYTNDWYNDTDKDDGGYTLEQINPTLACSYVNNWTVSSNVNGGTPGTQNAVYNNTADITGPNLIDFIATDANTFRITFDEPMDEGSLNGGTFSFDQGITENGISPISPGFFHTTIDVTPDLSSGIDYTITISGVTDCSGNLIQNNSASFAYDTNPPALDRIVVRTSRQIDIIFNEDLNKSIAETEGNYLSDHSGANPTSAILDDSQATRVNLTFADEFLLDVENTLTISNLEDLQGNALAAALTPTFALSQQVDTVHVMGINLLDIYFKQDLNPASANTPGNYLVDDEVGHPTTAFLDGSDSRLVHLAFANNFDDNKDLTLSLSDIQNSDLDFLTTPDLTFIYDTSSPKLDTLKVVSSNSLEITFTESVNEQSAESKENYEYEDIFPIQATLQPNRKTVLLQFANDFEREVIYELSIDEVKDLYENEIKTKLKQEFVYDIFEPQLDSIIVRSKNELILWFNENVNKVIAETNTNYQVGAGIGQPSSANLDAEFQHIVYLELSTDLPESSDIGLEITSMEDQRKNSITSTISSSFDFNTFYVSRIRSVNKNTIEIEFNKPPNTIEKNTVTNYVLNGEEAQAVNFSEDRVANITFPSDFPDDSMHTLIINNVTNQSSEELTVNAYTFNFDSRMESSGLVGDRTVLLVFEVNLKVGQALTLTDFDASPSLGNCIAAVIDSEEASMLRLTFEEALTGDIEYSISWQNLINSYDNTLPDYFITVIKDQTPPTISNYLLVDANTIWLKYSESIDETSAEFLNNYQVAPTIGFPIESTYNEADSTVLLEFSSGFIAGTAYTLTIDNIEDLSDNALFDHEIAFTFETPNTPSFGDLIITEIMADPTPEVGLTDAEYLEIYNTTSQAISLGGVRILDEGNSTTIISGEIAAESYVVLTTTSSAIDFTGVQVIGVSGFPSLSNAGETISLYSGDDQIFSTSYTSAWYKDSDKEDGGWALEMIDVSNPCGEISNWSASVDAAGGTPGRTNSIAVSNPDNFGPEILSAIAVSENTVLIEMNEKLHPEQFTNVQVTFSPIRAILTTELTDPQNNEISVGLAENLEAGQLYEVTINQVSDCQLNIIQSNQNTASFRLPQEALPLDLIVNEVLFNPRSGGVDFVEVYNNSENAINLKNWTLGDKITDLKTITEEHLVINPTEYMVLTTDPAILEANYPNGDASTFISMNSFPSLSDTGDSVILINDTGIIVDEMEYQDDYHFNLLDDDDGVSLERVSFEAESTNPDSWKSAASTVGFATPGALNSQFREETQSSATLSIHPQVFVPDNTGINDFTTISYQLNQAGNFANVHIYSTHGVLIKTLAEGELLSTKGFFTWDGITNNGSRAAVGYYVINFETFDGQGNRSIQKETVVLGSKF